MGIRPTDTISNDREGKSKCQNAKIAKIKIQVKKALTFYSNQSFFICKMIIFVTR